MGIQSLELRNGVSFLKHFIIGHLEHLGFFSSSSGRSSCKSHLIQLCYSSPSSTVEANCWHKWLFLTGLLLTFLPRICPSREVHCVAILMGFPINHHVLGGGGNLPPKPAHLCNPASYSVLCCYWYYCHAKLLWCSHYTHCASRRMDSPASSAAPLNRELQRHLRLMTVLS